MKKAFTVLEDLKLETPKTKDVINLLGNLNVDGKALIVTTEEDENVVRSANNIKGVEVLTVTELNVLDVLKHDTLLITKEAAEKAGEVLA